MLPFNIHLPTFAEVIQFQIARVTIAAATLQWSYCIVSLSGVGYFIEVVKGKILMVLGRWTQEDMYCQCNW